MNNPEKHKHSPGFVLNLDLVPIIKYNATILLAVLMEKMETKNHTEDGFITLSLKELEETAHLKRGRQQSGLKSLEEHNFIASKPKEGSRKRQFKINYEIADPNGLYRKEIKKEIKNRIVNK